MGVWALPTSELAFDDCFVPDSHRLSHEEGDGEAHLRKTPGRNPHRHRRAGARRRPRRARRGDPLRRRAPAVRQADQPLPGDPAQARRDGDRAGSGAPPGALRRLAARTTTSRITRRRRWPSCSPPRPRPRICDQAARVLASYGYSMEYPVQRYLRDVRFTLDRRRHQRNPETHHRQGAVGVSGAEDQGAAGQARPRRPRRRRQGGGAGADGRRLRRDLYRPAADARAIAQGGGGGQGRRDRRCRSCPARTCRCAGASASCCWRQGLYDKLWIVGGNIPEAGPRWCCAQLGFQGRVSRPAAAPTTSFRSSGRM